MRSVCEPRGGPDPAEVDLRRRVPGPFRQIAPFSWIMYAVSDTDLVDVTISGPDEEWLAEFTHRIVTDR